MKKHFSTILLVLVFFAGLSLLLYPSFSNWWNQRHATSAIASYTSITANADKADVDATLTEAYLYNERHARSGNSFSQRSPEQMEEYAGQLSMGGSSMMGFLTIPKIKVSLPIYHGTEEDALNVGVGHLAGTSLPVGGPGTHTVLSGHRGLPSARLFTDLDQLVVGDEFYLEVYGQTLTYEVDQILIVLPEEVQALAIYSEQDLCTLVTCTPYGINTHRILVRGHRIANGTSEIRITADAIQLEPITIVPFIALPILLGLLVWLIATTGKKRGGKHHVS